MSFWTLEMILNRALMMEKQSYDFDLWTKERALTLEAKILLNELAEEELEHQRKISDALKNRKLISEIGSNTEIEDLKIIEWLKDVTLSEDATYQDILIFAGKQEKETYEYYLNLSGRSRNTDVRKLFSMLAQEELKHKNRIEREYDQYVLEI